MTEKQASSEIAQSRELQQAIKIANLFLDRPYFDPDGDECVLARQFLRQQERLAAAERDTRERSAQIVTEFEAGWPFGSVSPHKFGQFLAQLAERIRGKE